VPGRPGRDGLRAHTPHVLRGMGLSHLSKNATAIKELTEKGMAPD